MRTLRLLLTLITVFAVIAACAPQVGQPIDTDVDEGFTVDEIAFEEPEEDTEEEPSAPLTAAEPDAPFDLGGATILVGTDANYPPFDFTENDGTIIGIDPDLMAAICGIANCVPEFLGTPREGMYTALADGEFDVLMSAITIRPGLEEEANATFTTPYFEVGQVVLVRAEEDLITGTGELSAALVGVQRGSTGDVAATEGAGVPDDGMVRFDTLNLAVLSLLDGDIDAVVFDGPTAQVYADVYPDQLKIVGEPFTAGFYGILVSDESPELLVAFNYAIDELTAAGRIDEIAEEWTAPEEE
jgi:polar amino acid transport system substrate-binding protein